MMGRCSKCKYLNIFYVILIFCVVNLFVYRYYFHKTKVTISSVDGKNINLDEHVSISTSGMGEPSRRTVGILDSSSTTLVNVSKSGTLPGSSLIPAYNPSSSSSSLLPSGNNPIQPYMNGSVTDTSGAITTAVNISLPQCPMVAPNLVGPLATYSHAISFDKIARDNPSLLPGGRFKPKNCIARHRVAIIIPYRNREEHLQILLNNLHPMLMRQQLDYGVFVVDQLLPTKFNRAMLMNIGYAEAMKRYNYQCAIFHDVDLIPENDRNIYSCPEMPRHLSAAIDKFRYRLPYVGIYGGVSAVNKQQFEKMNGFSNKFFGWGGEDDDMATRIRVSGFKITRYPMDIARYRMIKHSTEKGNEQNPLRYGLLQTTQKRMSTDGLSSLKYQVKAVHAEPTHLRLEIFINQADIMKS